MTERQPRPEPQPQPPRGEQNGDYPNGYTRTLRDRSKAVG